MSGNRARTKMTTIPVYINILYSLVLTSLNIPTCCCFLLDDGTSLSSLCLPQDKYCTCFDYSQTGEFLDIECTAKNITLFPNFTMISEQIIGHYWHFWLYLEDNELTSIPSFAFWNFNCANKIGNAIVLEFARNKINIIENAAFVGINNMDVVVNLTDNRITSLPLAFALLHNLTVLAISGNPILAFDSATVNTIAKSMYSLEIDYEALVLGNQELSVLNLSDITIRDISSDFWNLNFNPFLFFRNTMPNLLITGTDLTTLPCSLTDGPEMKYLFIENALNISANSVFDCRPGTTLNVFDLEIMHSGLAEFPDILNFTPSLLALNVFYNNIRSINAKFIPLHNKLRVLNLSYNQLTTIPAFFNRFNNLLYLYIEHNQISYVAPESNVLSIKSLCAAGNPWQNNSLNCVSYYSGSFLWIDNTNSIT